MDALRDVLNEATGGGVRFHASTEHNLLAIPLGLWRAIVRARPSRDADTLIAMHVPGANPDRVAMMRLGTAADIETPALRDVKRTVRDHEGRFTVAYTYPGAGDVEHTFEVEAPVERKGAVLGTWDGFVANAGNVRCAFAMNVA